MGGARRRPYLGESEKTDSCLVPGRTGRRGNAVLRQMFESAPAVSAAQALASFQALSVFFMSIATVIGPTPPGTGVIFEQSGETLGKWTSPVRR